MYGRELGSPWADIINSERLKRGMEELAGKDALIDNWGLGWCVVCIVCRSREYQAVNFPFRWVVTFPFTELNDDEYSLLLGGCETEKEVWRVSGSW